jgi:hypothetical protein
MWAGPLERQRWAELKQRLEIMDPAGGAQAATLCTERVQALATFGEAPSCTAANELSKHLPNYQDYFIQARIPFRGTTLCVTVYHHAYRRGEGWCTGLQ